MMTSLGAVLVLALSLACSAGASSPPGTGPALDFDGVPPNEYEYSLRRDAMLQAEREYEGRTLKLNDDEAIVNQYLEFLKWKEFLATKVSGYGPANPIERKLDYIPTTEVYRVLQSLPKGGNMHSHEDHQVSRKLLLDIVWDSDEFQYLYLMPGEHPSMPWQLDFFVNPPNDKPAWIKVQNSQYTKEYLLGPQTMLGLMNDKDSCASTDSNNRWNIINWLWSRNTNLIANINIKTKYLNAMYQQGLEQGLIYHETRKNMGSGPCGLYVMDPSGASAATNGKKYLADPLCDLVLGQNLPQQFAASNPYFVGHKRISSSQRQSPINGSFKTQMYNVFQRIKLFPDELIGWDMVGQEDAGYSTMYYLERLLDPNVAGLPFFMHGAETSWPDELIASDMVEDPVGTLPNSLDILLLHTNRVGHGLGLIKHPYRLEIIQQRQIPLEICPVSNQILGFSPDLRNHPGLHFLRWGIPIIIGADDPGTMGYDNITIDWYEIFMAWGLDLADMKTIARNSLAYSGMTADEKHDAIENKWTPMWNKYIADKKQEACSYNYKDGSNPKFIRLLPRVGANKGTTTVHVYGRNFHQAICKQLQCQFGGVASPHVEYVDQNHLICYAPEPADTTQRSVPVTVSLDGGQSFIDTGLTFTYKYDPVTPVPSPPKPPPATRRPGFRQPRRIPTARRNYRRL